MKTKLVIAGVGNLIDIFATFILTQYFGVPELNPFMAWLLQWPVFAMVFKFIVVNSVLLYTWYSKRTKYSDMLATIAAWIYGGIGAYYIVNFIIIATLFFN
jgi:phosphoglycerol transferase MdoB-like AlkP superfamily enzyme